MFSREEMNLEDSDLTMIRTKVVKIVGNIMSLQAINIYI